MNSAEYKFYRLADRLSALTNDFSSEEQGLKQTRVGNEAALQQEFYFRNILSGKLMDFLGWGFEW